MITRVFRLEKQGELAVDVVVYDDGATLVRDPSQESIRLFERLEEIACVYPTHVVVEFRVAGETIPSGNWGRSNQRIV